MPKTIVFEPILPTRRNYPLGVADALEKSLEMALRGPVESVLVRGFKLRVSGWSKAPQFKGKYVAHARSVLGTGMAITVGPFGQNKRKWIWVSGGTKRHFIVAHRTRDNPTLPIRKYTPHTRKGGRYGGPGSYSSDVRYVHYPKGVWQEIEPREFEKDIADERKDEIYAELLVAIERALR